MFSKFSFLEAYSILQAQLCFPFSGHEVSLSVEPVISPIILNMWVSHVSDPFISIDALEVLEVKFLYFTLSFAYCGLVI